jgi:cobalt-precorrin 5A hydrolase
VNLRLLAFSDKGEALADRLAQTLEGEAARCGQPMSLAQWTADAFAQADGLIFVGAAGIAVRAIAPWVKSKTTDPAVVVVDECAHFAVPILSGHLGGANDLARRIARLCGAIPVLTTATDANGVFAVDEWSKRQSCVVVNPEKIKAVSGAVLAGRSVRVFSPWMIEGDAPDGVEQTDSRDCDVRLDVYGGSPGALHLAPKLLTLGLGCRKGTAQETMEAAFQSLLAQSGVLEQSIRAAASIDLKQGEPGLLAFCQAHGWSCTFYSAQELEKARGDFTPSAFVREITGVDNVCERAAVLQSGGALIWNKTAGNGVTMALAQAPYKPTWRWQDDGE